ALRHVLDQPPVAAAIVGARSTAHLAPTLAATRITLTTDESRTLAALLGQSSGPLGDVYTLERDQHGRHGSIMRYNLNDDR
ncbi:MAG: aldo/keto reductase, partial [Gemmatimonadaceae bacterium]|nr:aldo/keto reductase [Gemmatimonadaceae bacterium]